MEIPIGLHFSYLGEMFHWDKETEMATAVEIIFTGICAFLPMKPNDAVGVTVVFPKGNDHGVRLVMADDQWDVTSSDETILPMEHRDGYYLVKVEDAILTLDDIQAGIAPSLEPKRVFYRRHPADADDHESLYWLARLRSVAPAGGELANVFDTHTTPATSWIEIPYGTLTGKVVSPFVWRIQPRRGVHLPWEHAMAQEIRWDLDVSSGNTVKFTATRFADASKRATLTLTEKGDGKRFITLENTPLLDALPHACDPCCETCDRPCEREDHHFEQYYKLFKEEPPVKPYPYLLMETKYRDCRVATLLESRNKMIDVRKVTGANCPPVVIEK
jgi:hypothetical protein